MPIELTHGIKERTPIITNIGSSGGAPGYALQSFIGETGRRNFERGMLERRSELEKEGFEFKLTAQQKADQEKLQNALYDIEQSDLFSDEEKEKARRDIMTKYAGIKPMPKIKEDTRTMKERFKQETYTDESGDTWGATPEGGWKRIGTKENVGLKIQDKTKLWHDALALAEGDYNRALEIYNQSIAAITGGGMGGDESSTGIQGQEAPVGALPPGQEESDLSKRVKGAIIAPIEALKQETQGNEVLNKAWETIIGGGSVDDVVKGKEPIKPIEEEAGIVTPSDKEKVQLQRDFPLYEQREGKPQGTRPEWVFRNETTGKEIFEIGKPEITEKKSITKKQIEKEPEVPEPITGKYSYDSVMNLLTQAGANDYAKDEVMKIFSAMNVAKNKKDFPKVHETFMQLKNWVQSAEFKLAQRKKPTAKYSPKKLKNPKVAKKPVGFPALPKTYIEEYEEEDYKRLLPRR